MLELSIDEFNVLTVMCDLLKKGQPETRIAKYLIEKFGDAMAYERTVKFVRKLKLSAEWEKRILDRYKALYTEGFTVWNVDAAQNLGGSLRRSAFYSRRGTPLTRKRKTV